MKAVIDVQQGETLQLKFLLPVRFEKKDGWVVATCDVLDVCSQGRDETMARSSIVEAISLFLETCFEMETLHEVLRARGFTQMQAPAHSPGVRQSKEEMIEVPMELVANAQAQAGKVHSHC